MSLEEIGKKYGTDKYEHLYLPFYEGIFKDMDIKYVMEIGVWKGASIKMWREYFPEATIVGVDTLDCTPIEGCTLIKADATTKEFADSIGMFDMILDDGGHKTSMQINSFKYLWGHINPGGIYILEDAQTSYFEQFVDTDILATDYIREFSDTHCDKKYIEFIGNSKFVGAIVLFKNK